MKTAVTFTVGLAAAIACTAPLFLLSAQQNLKAKVMFAEPTGVVTARETKTGRTFQFTVPADVAAGLKAGDAVDVNFGGMRVTGVKGAVRTAQIREPDPVEPCCSVVAFATDSAALEALLRGLSGAEPTGATNAANPNMDTGSALKALLSRVSNAEPVGATSATLDFRSLLRTADPINGIIDPVEPINGIALLRDLSSGAYHVVAVSGTPPPGAIGSAATVAVDNRAGVALFRSGGQTYSHPLLRPAQGGSANKGPWVITPNARLSGIMGRLVTKFPEKTDSSGRLIYVYAPGTTEDHVSVAATGEDQDIVEGEYDVKVMRVTVPNVPIKKGHETRLLIGALTFAGRDQSLHYVFDSTGQKQLFQIIGYEIIAVPAGTYSLKAGNRVIPFEIKDGEVTAL
ncbi:MAG: hypothetical protein WD716_09795 [Fimbriimonadaceae bacterium]